MRSKRQIAAESKALSARLDEALTLLAAAVLQYGNSDGHLLISGRDLDRVSHDADGRTVSLRLLLSGDMRVDFTRPAEPDMTMTIVEDAPCSST